MASKSMINTGNKGLDKKIAEWLKWNKNIAERDEVYCLLGRGDTEILANLFLKRLEFGTAGLRGCMGPGYSQINDLVIVQTGQGLVKYLLDAIPIASSKGVIIGYDGRYNSKRFAELTAAIFIANNIKVYLFSDVCPTPFIPYGILKFKCAAGIMITASHNPKQDNGYKVYWDNGAQIVSPHDKNIQKHILENLEPLDSSWQVSELYESNLCEDPLGNIMHSYFNDFKEHIVYPEVNKNTILKFTYTPMHGVGYKYMKAAFEAANFKPFIAVEKQRLPNPEFPTVKFPNPEEGKSALDLSITTANEYSSSIILANDPDADRVACAIKQTNGEWYIFSGNELGALLGWWMLHLYKVKYPDSDLSDVYMLSSTVSSKILASMARKEGFKFEETLTGFKWMGNKAVDLLKEGKDVLFAYEEAIGFMCGSKVLDKDGICAGVCVAQMAAYLETMGLSLRDKLEKIYNKYGWHICENSYWICHKPNTIKTIFERLRNYDGKENTYPSVILGGKYSVVSVRDLTTGYDSSKPDNKAVLPVSKSSQMITFTFNNGLVTTLRTSGTEPKIKYYSELYSSPEAQDLSKLKFILKEMMSAIVEEFLEPKINSLIPRNT